MNQGFYTDPPARRIGYDKDGTIGLRIDRGGVVSQLSSDAMEYLNKERDVPYGGAIPSPLGFGQQTPFEYLVLIFPEKRDITDIFRTMSPANYSLDTASSIQYSYDTTNGVDGLWISDSTYGVDSQPPQPAYRDQIVSVGLFGIKAIKFMYPGHPAPSGMRIGKIHLYGKISPSETPHRLIFCDSLGSEFARDFDFGDQKRDTTLVWTGSNGFNLNSGLYLKNNSSDRVANNIVVSIEDTSHSLGSDMIDYLTLSKDGVSWDYTLSWTKLDPGEMVGPILVKSDIPAGATLGVEASRLVADVESWT